MNWKRLFIIPLVFALAVGPVRGESSNSNDGDQATIAAPEPPPAPVPDSDSATNGTAKTSKKHKPSGDHPPVRIDHPGIYVGGADPVTIKMPNLGSGSGASMMGGSTLGMTLVALASVVVPFVFLTALAGSFFYFRYRRNRMLHETLRAMIEKGVAIPPELIVPPDRSIRRRMGSDLRSGLIMLGAGVGLMVLAGRVGLIPIFIGVALLITRFIEKKENNHEAANK